MHFLFLFVLLDATNRAASQQPFFGFLTLCCLTSSGESFIRDSTCTCDCSQDFGLRACNKRVRSLEGKLRAALGKRNSIENRTEKFFKDDSSLDELIDRHRKLQTVSNWGNGVLLVVLLLLYVCSQTEFISILRYPRSFWGLSGYDAKLAERLKEVRLHAHELTLRREAEMSRVKSTLDARLNTHSNTLRRLSRECTLSQQKAGTLAHFLTAQKSRTQVCDDS